MFDLFYRTAYVAVYFAMHSFNYATPLLVSAVALITAYLYFPDTLPLSAWLAGAACLLPLLVLYILTTLHAMLHPEDPPQFWQIFHWRARHWDFLIFTLTLFLVLMFLIIVVGDTTLSLIDYIWFLEDTEREAQINTSLSEKYGYGRTNILVLLFGSRLLAAAFFIFAMLLWFYFFRSLIKMPAHVENYQLSTEEAMMLTRSNKWRIMLVSLLINIGLLIIFSFVPWRQADLWLRALLAGVWLWLLLHANLAFATALYQEYADGYSMRRVRY